MSIEEEVRRRISEILKQPIQKLQGDVPLSDLVADSFALVEMAIGLQEDFSVRLSQEDLIRVRTVADLNELIVSRARS